MLSVSPTTLVVEKRVGGVEFSDLACLDLGRKLNFTSTDMADLQRQGIYFDDYNNPVPNNIPYAVPQKEDGYSWILEGIICLRRSKKLHNTYAAFKNYSCEELMNMTKLEFFNFIYC